MGSRVTTAGKPRTTSPPKRSRIGDLRMRDVYRGSAVLAAAAVVAAAVWLVLPSGPGEGERPVAAPSAAPTSSGAPSPAPTDTRQPTDARQPVGVAQPAGSAQPVARPTPSPGTTLAPGYTAMEALYADRRLPRLPGKLKQVTRADPGKKVISDKRTGLAVPRPGGTWKVHRPAPFTSKQVLPKVRGQAERGLLVSCPLPIEAQKHPRDTALLAARWTLNHHPEDSVVRWVSSQPVKGGWALVYQVTYGKRSSLAAVVVIDGGMSKPGLVFASVPDTQRKRWRDIYRVVSGARVLG
ncbi:hypothetical protein [Nonomuraea typhae]|uniref:hypothetical protein n=1 Tax=Nonomuraea typhae TaxID=2603600 RepID=UPI001FE4FBE9|nr:hypothetical protein [Nonomuraea typhae]